LEGAGQAAPVDLISRQARNGRTVQAHLARSRHDQSAYEIKERGFACAVRANHRVALALGDDQVDATDDFGRTEIFFQSPQFQGGPAAHRCDGRAGRGGKSGAHPASPFPRAVSWARSHAAATDGHAMRTSPPPMAIAATAAS